MNNRCRRLRPNPVKISATLETLHAFPGRLLLMFQPHGYGPICLMRDALVGCFARGLRDEDVLVMPEPVYFAARSTAASAAAILFAKSSGAAERPLLFRTASPAATCWSGWRAVVIASWSWRARRFAFAVRR